MGSGDFICLDPSSDSEHQREVNGLHESNSIPGEPEGVPDGSNLVETGENEEMEGGVVSDIATDDLVIDEGSIAGVKRARRTNVDQQPFVRVVYNSLTRESKRKLMELMQQWSEWHAQCKSSSVSASNSAQVSSEVNLETGKETYFPALHVGSEKASVSFWVDNQARNVDIKNAQLDSESIPLYDRGCTLGSTSVSGSADSERMDTLEASRCFNCGSYSHSLKECTKPRNNVAINKARKQHNSKRKSTPASCGQLRYYQKSQGKFDGLKAGVLGPETRESLGIGELDPPPWLHRMRELGYPPGYLDIVEDEDQPSGISIFGEVETGVEYEDGELPEKDDSVPPEKKMTVEFPGINAPIPENADHRRWAAIPSGSHRYRTQYQRSSRLVDPQRGQYSDYQRNDGPQKGNEGLASTDYESSSGTAAVHSYSPRYSPCDHSNSPHTPWSPSLGRSLSDRGWQNPVRNDGSSVVHSPCSPYPYPNPNPSGSRQSPAHPYASPPAGPDQWATDTSSLRQEGKEWHDLHNGHHRRHRRN